MSTARNTSARARSPPSPSRSSHFAFWRSSCSPPPQLDPQTRAAAAPTTGRCGHSTRRIRSARTSAIRERGSTDRTQRDPHAGRRHVLLPSGCRHLGAGRLAGLRGRVGTVVRARGGRVTVDCGTAARSSTAHRARSARRESGGGRRDRARLHPGEAGARPPDPSRAQPACESARSRSPHPVCGPYDAEGARDRGASALRSPALRRRDRRCSGVGSPWRWHGSGDAARLTWRIERNGRIIVATRVARDVRASVPLNAAFWTTFARGTHQNWPIFAGKKLQFRPGVRLRADEQGPRGGHVRRWRLPHRGDRRRHGGQQGSGAPAVRRRERSMTRSVGGSASRLSGS